MASPILWYFSTHSSYIFTVFVKYSRRIRAVICVCRLSGFSLNFPRRISSNVTDAENLCLMDTINVYGQHKKCTFSATLLPRKIINFKMVSRRRKYTIVMRKQNYKTR